MDAAQDLRIERNEKEGARTANGVGKPNVGQIVRVAATRLSANGASIYG